MKLAVLIVVLLGIAPRSFGQYTPAENIHDVICWQEGRKLTWKDFQALNRPAISKEDSLPGAFVGATTQARAVIYDLVDAGRYTGIAVSVKFYKDESWVRKPWITTTYEFERNLSLSHEQVHFDIVELTGRKLRQVLAGYVPAADGTLSPVITDKISCIYNEEDELQILYDEESVFGNEWGEQWRWEKLIKKQLSQLSKYKSTAKDCMVP